MAVEDAHKALAFKADQLERSNKYKSDFLANMSHELRTPLNSVLILAKLLGENRTKNMTEKQVEHANVIHKSGSDLLVIINDILDLSKIEAGKLHLHNEKTEIAEICNNMTQLFMEVSRDKKIRFSTGIDFGMPEYITTDRVRIEQVLKNLLGNAFKFTPEGGEVHMKAYMVTEPIAFQNEKLRQSKKVICFSVCDSGIGIPEDKQRLIFEAFNQADSSITRKFGGTGLGLAICRQLSSLLGGEIALSSVEGKGSVFSLFVSAELEPVTDQQSEQTERFDKHTNDETSLANAGNVLLLCDDERNTSVWKSLFALENFIVKNVKISETDSVNFTPDIIILDATLPDREYIDKVKRLKEKAITKNAEIVCRSISEFVPREISKLVKIHTTAAINQTLVASILQSAIASRAMVGNKQGGSVKETEMKDLGITDYSTNQTLTGKLTGIKVLIADDDIRNIYSMTSIFEHEGAEVIYAMDGFEAIEQFIANPDLSIIMMDVMMPGKDGLQAMSTIRSLGYNSSIPIVAVTAKAMPDDKEICMNAGANDYITKPVNVDLLLKKVYQLLKDRNV